jgi:hypothetical protein
METIEFAQSFLNQVRTWSLYYCADGGGGSFASYESLSTVSKEAW